MTNDCLVTKLKGVVNNETLPKFGMITFHVNNPENLTDKMTYFKYADSTEATKNFYEVGSGVTADFITSQIYPRFTGEGYVRVKNKYNITDIVISSRYQSDSVTPSIDMDISQLSYNNLQSISCTPQGLHITNLKDLQILKPTLKGITLNERDILVHQLSGDISDLAKFVNLETLNLSYISNKVHGTMEQVATLFPKLNSLGDLTDTKWLAGSIEDFVTVRRSQGVNDGSVYTKWGIFSNVTFNGEKLKGQDNTPFSWTATTITYNGVTINA